MLHLQVFNFSPIQENTYVLHTSEKLAVIIDPGCYAASEEIALDEFITGNNLTVTQLWQTHCHLDHVFGLKYCAERYLLQPHMHPAETQVLQFAEMSGDMWGLPFTAYHGPTHLLQPNEHLHLGSYRFHVLFVPGHSPGHVAFYCQEEGLVIGGDVLFRESIGRTDLPGGNHEQLLQSIQEKLLVLPGDTRVYPGHGPHTTIAHEAQNNPFLQ